MRFRALIPVFAAVMLVAASQAQAADVIDPSITGTVTTAAATPISGVVVQARQSGAVISSTISDASGGYSLNVPDGSYTVAFTAPTTQLNSLSALAVEVPRNWPLDVVLSAPSVGRVFLSGDVALANGVPITGGSVLFAGAGVRQAADGYFSMAHPAGVTGTWSLSGTAIPSAGQTMSVAASGGPRFTMMQDTDTQLTVPTTQSTVRVTDASGVAIADAQVSLNVGGFGNPDGLMPIIDGQAAFSGNWNASARTDSNGQVTLTRPLLSVAVTGTLTMSSPNPALGSSQVNVTIPPAGGLFAGTLTAPRVTLSGNVSYSDSTPAAGASVIFAGSGNSTNASGTYSTITTPGTTGKWMLNGSRTVNSARLTWFASGAGSETVNAARTQNFIVPLTTTPMRIVNAAGVGISGAQVSVNAVGTLVLTSGGEPFSIEWNAMGTTDATGRVDLPALRTNAFATSAGQAATINLTPPLASAYLGRGDVKTTVSTAMTTLTMQAGVAITSGTVKFTDGAPVPGAVVMPVEAGATVNGGNSADLTGNYSVTKPVGFAGESWRISCRAQSSLPIPDPLCFTLSGGAARIWNQNATVNFTIPKNFYRMRLVDSQGSPVANMGLQISVGDTARVDVSPGESAFSGSWRGIGTTGADGWAQVPGVVMGTQVLTTVSINPDSTSRYVGRTITLMSSTLSDTVVVLQIKPPMISSASVLNATAGDVITLTGVSFTGASSVKIGGVASQFTVVSDTQLKVTVPSNAVSGVVTVANGGGTGSTSQVITVATNPLSISTTQVVNPVVGSAFSTQLQAVGGTAPYRWVKSSGALPTGITLTPTGALTGTPTRAITSTGSFTVFDARGASVNRLISITVDPKPFTVPGAISAIGASAGSSRIALQWKAPVDNGGNVIKGYSIQRSTDGTNWASFIPNTQSTSIATSFTAEAGVQYWFRVAAINAAGVGVFGVQATVGPVTAYGPPSVPTDLRVTANVGSVTVNWSGPTNTGGALLTGYRIRKSTNGTAWTTVVADTRSLATTLTVAASRGSSVWIQVSAINIAGLSNYATTPTSIRVQ